MMSERDHEEMFVLKKLAEAVRAMFHKIDHEGYHCNAPVIGVRDAFNAYEQLRQGQRR